MLIVPQFVVLRPREALKMEAVCSSEAALTVFRDSCRKQSRRPFAFRAALPSSVSCVSTHGTRLLVQSQEDCFCIQGSDTHDVSGRMRLASRVARTCRNIWKNRSVGKSVQKLEYNIKMDLRVVCKYVYSEAGFSSVRSSKFWDYLEIGHDCLRQHNL